MSGGGGKGGSKKTETTIPEWVRAPADRNLQRAEAVQQIKYMPYTGGQVAALTPTQEAAMNNNISTAQAFGLLDPNSTLTATSGMPEPTTYDNGMKGYGSIGLYDQALKELTARDPANMAAYNNLFGNAVPANVARGGGGRGGGSISFGGQPQAQPRAVIPNQTKYGADRSEAIKGGRGINRSTPRGSGNIAGSQNKNYIANVRRQTVNNRAKAAGTFGRKYSGDY
jgi:hypothetical protein